MHAEAAERVGILLLGMLHMVNTNVQRGAGRRPASNCRASICLIDKASSLKASSLEPYKRQAPSLEPCKRQASSLRRYVTLTTLRVVRFVD